MIKTEAAAVFPALGKFLGDARFALRRVQYANGRRRLDVTPFISGTYMT
jgi:hypothetical protein